MRPQVKWIAGRSRNSHMLLAWAHVHLFVWVPWTSGGDDSFGMTLRWRRAEGWTHVRMVIFQRNKIDRSRWKGRRGHWLLRRTLTLFEITRWDTRPGVYGRHGMKSYIRVKISPGGRELPEGESGTTGHSERTSAALSC